MVSAWKNGLNLKRQNISFSQIWAEQTPIKLQKRIWYYVKYLNKKAIEGSVT